MNAAAGERRLKWAYPFAVLTEPDVVRLVAGEDRRFTLRAPGLDAWLPATLAQIDGRATLTEVVAGLPAEQREAALALVERLLGERALVDASAREAFVPARRRWRVEGPAAATFADLARDAGEAVGVVWCQDRLDYAAALDRARASRDANEPMLWISTGALERGYVGPLLLPDAGPCFACLLAAFRRLSPAPEVHDALLAHARAGKPLPPAPFPEEATAVLRAVAAWKLRHAESAEPPAGLFRLHVVEAASLETSTHRLFVDPECREHRR